MLHSPVSTWPAPARLTCLRAHGGVDIPQPPPDVVPLPPSPHPGPPAPDMPPEIKEPPGGGDMPPPVREPGMPGDPVRTTLH